MSYRAELKSWTPIGLLVLIPVLTGCTQRYTGPWNLDELYQPPAVEWIDSEGPVRSLYYANEPFEGHPTRVFAYYAVPEQRAARVPAMVLVHGGGGKAFREWAELWAQRGYAAIAMDLAGRGPDGQRLPDGGPDQGHPEKFNAIEQGIRHAWPYHAVAAVVRAHSLLRSLPEVDPDHTGVTGISWGGYLTCIVAGLDDRFKAAVPVYGCGFLDEDSAWVEILAGMSPENRQLWIENFDPSRYLPGCRTPILFVNGTNDFAYPLSSYQKSYRLVRGPRTLCITVRMPHSHPDGWAPKEIGLFADSILRGGQPLARFGSTSRDGRQVRADIWSAVPLREAGLHYTTDTGPWKTREWKSLPATVSPDGRTITALLPSPVSGETTGGSEVASHNGLVWFLTATDERGAVVSTEHEVLGG